MSDPKLGRWIDAREQCGSFVCPKCEYQCHAYYKFCPECGAEMIGGAKNGEPAPAWIPCSERLPEKDTPVLICGSGHRVTAYYDAVYGVFRLTESDDLFYLKSAVTHWMPLPEPPKKNEVRDDD